MKKHLLALLGIVSLATMFYSIGHCQDMSFAKRLEVYAEDKRVASIEEARELLRSRKDQAALIILEKILAEQPENLEALWGKAEVLRRRRFYQEAEAVLKEILKRDPGHNPSLISLAYIRYKEDELKEALILANKVIKAGVGNKDNQALAYMMLGSINSRLFKKCFLFGKIKSAFNIKSNFFKARDLAPHLPEVHLALGTFYLLAPSFFGGDLNKALEELEAAVEIAPDFATACARLAQVYRKKGIEDKFHHFIERAKNLDPANEVLREIEE